MQNILLIGTFESLTFAILLSLLKRRRSVSDLILALFFVILSLTMFLGWMENYNRSHRFAYPMFLFTASPVILLHGPALWFYIKSLTKQQFAFKPLYLLHLVPFMLMVIQHTVDFYLLSTPQKIALAVDESFMKFLSYPVFLSMVVVSPLVYFVWGLLLIKRYNERLKNYFSKVNDINLSWLRTLLMVSIAFYAAINLAFLVLIPQISFHLLQLISFSFSTLYVLFLGFYGHRQVNLFSSINPIMELDKIDHFHLAEQLSNDDELFIKQLIELMQRDRPYLNPELTLASLSKMAGKSPEYLSAILNNQLNMNFFDFINNYRVEEFKRVCRLSENRDYTIIAVAYSCGFNSKATFYRVFKNATGLTPSEYMAGLN